MITALLIFFWGVVPGLITGWMLRERGRSFLPGLLLGAVCGPLGILGVLTFIYISDRRQGGRRRAVRVFYDIPVVGRLHVSTVWMLAGVATFLCLWMIGGISYEVYRAEPRPEPSPEQARQTAGEPAQPKALLPTNGPSEKQPPETRLSEQTPQGNPTNQAHSALVGNFSGQPASLPPPSGNSATNWQPAPPAGNGTQPASAAPAAAPPQPNAQPAPQPPKTPAPARADAIAEVTRDLAANGHRVHAALSGNAQNATLSLTGETLTREAGNQLLGNGRLRGALKAAGVRIVVLMNGEQSWTYML
ncbi:MAG: hypothetical protein JOZ96_28705 [Acidobacteria bacterium]|nr:hypothetical protein [Acidobacteriota bacterium]MBV9929028.1 hypothetical protein [Acidobacteriota bacterium]